MKISGPAINLLIELHRKGEITNSKSRLAMMTYYTIVRYLKSLGVVECSGVNDRNEKIWKLTEKGKKIAKLYYELELSWKGGLDES